MDQLDTIKFEDAALSFDSELWGERGSIKEYMGMLNLLTPEIRLQAIKSVVDGHSFGLNWQMKFLDEVSFGRIKYEHKLVEIAGFGSFDDTILIDPQTTSQLDGFRHHPSSLNGLWYGNTTKEDILNTDRMGIGAWAQAGIVGRGVLIDYERYIKRKNASYNPFSPHPVTVAEIEEIAKESKITFQRGDILLLRVGYTKAWESFSVEERKDIVKNRNYSAGLENSKETLRWIWENKFAVLAADCIGLECFPPVTDDNSLMIHDYALATWGIPIGELWYLEALADHCAQTGRYTCFVCSAPFNQANGVSSIANCVATT